MAADRRIHVLDGPGAGVDAGYLKRWCERWSDELGVELRFAACADERALADALDGARDALGAVVNPGGAAVAPLAEAADAAGVPVAWVDLAAAERPRPPHLDDPAVIGVRGRGVTSYRWAAMWLMQRLDSPCEVIRYGPERDQAGDLRMPAGPAGPVPVAVLLHGGFWRERWERDTIEPLAIDLARRGFATWSLEYRRVGPFGGGWPGTFADVAAGSDHLTELARERPLDLDRLVFVGHSAGGHLALWAVRRTGFEPPSLRPSLVVSLAGIGDLEECARRGLGDTGNAALDLLGGSDVAPASPLAALPLGVPQLIVQGEADNTPDLVDMNVSYAAAARAAGDEVELLLRPDVGHFDVIDPGSAVWREAAERIESACGDERGALGYPAPGQTGARVREAAERLPRDTPPASCDTPPPSPRWR